MEHVFGNTFICSDLETANKVAFESGLGKLCVTLDGDSVNPGGTMSGGAAPAGGSFLAQVAAVKEVAEQMEAKREEVRQLETDLKRIGPLGREFAKLQHQAQLKKTALEQVQERLSHTDYQKFKDEFDALKEDTERLEEEMEAARKVEAENGKKIKELEYKLKNAKQIKEKAVKVSRGLVELGL